MQATSTHLNSSIEKLWETRPFIISGPCSAETPEQILETAKLLASSGQVDLFRAGIWKPRTKPGMFEGIGSEALGWLLEAKKYTGLPVCVEVATAKHVEDALKFDTDLLWIGARTTVSPFSVQAVAEALKGVNVPVLIKNPVNPDIELWSGAIERLQQIGLSKIGMIHRGFSNYGDAVYRNTPMWHIPIEMKLRFPNMLMLCDPSHICGNRIMLKEIAQKSINLGFNGLMIESHINPDFAWSDAKQQITPTEVAQLITQLIWRSETSNEAEYLIALSKFRQQINQIDDELLSLLSQRMKIAEKIGEHKRSENIIILQANRWTEIAERVEKYGASLGLSAEFIARYLDALHLESINHQNKIMNGTKE
ncbi:MAG: bifunctional 3-deoxy-7-phosphoheptulonate synthase/chorismate mutase type II [Bacteroidetes bacterium]|nr:bifunctional 3-deoxy-7-phosphoheptulonate synthase/chorismate mutase type II [Bacteroidota bacterium]